MRLLSNGLIFKGHNDCQMAKLFQRESIVFSFSMDTILSFEIVVLRYIFLRVRGVRLKERKSKT